MFENSNLILNLNFWVKKAQEFIIFLLILKKRNKQVKKMLFHHVRKFEIEFENSKLSSNLEICLKS